MPSTINASTSSGIVQTADTSGTLELQSAGTTKLTITSTGAYGQLVSGTAVASTSGTSIDFTSIPSWVKRISVLFNAVSTNGSSLVEVRIGSGSITSSGYVSYGSAGASNMSTTTGFLTTYAMAASYSMSGKVEICLVSGTTYIASGTLGLVPLNGNISGGTVTLGGVLDRVRITTVGGTDTFDAGSINILYEG